MKLSIVLFALMSAMAIVARGQSGDEHEDTILINPEKLACFPGGNDSLTSFIKRNLIKPPNNQTKGKVFVSFVVNENGSLNEFTIVKGLSTECDRSALEVVKKMPDWIPGKIYNTPVRQRYTLPVTFD